MSTMRRPLIAFAALLSLVSCAKDEPTVGAVPITSAVILTDDAAVALTVEAADTEDEREHGLMDRTSLGADDGMVFLFDAPSSGSFWMKDTLIPLSIAFWDEDGRIVGIRDMDPCTADPCPTYGSPEPYVGALEVNQGFFEEHGVVIGDRIELS
jgi:uncharacterized membrane protein (UPF0127 family)